MFLYENTVNDQSISASNPAQAMAGLTSQHRQIQIHHGQVSISFTQGKTLDIDLGDQGRPILDRTIKLNLSPHFAITLMRFDRFAEMATLFGYPSDASNYTFSREFLTCYSSGGQPIPLLKKYGVFSTQISMNPQVVAAMKTGVPNATSLESFNSDYSRSVKYLYAGQVKNKKRGGFGLSLERHANESMLYLGQHLNDKFSGEGFAYHCPRGGETNLYHNQPHWYYGQWVNGQKNGYGLSAKIQQRFEGWRSSRLNVSIYTIYEGNFLNGLPHGFGVEMVLCAERYTAPPPDEHTGSMLRSKVVRYGMFERGKLHGYGIEIVSRVGRYEGQFVNGVYRGLGIYAVSVNHPLEVPRSGTTQQFHAYAVLSPNFANGKPSGYSIVSDGNGEYWAGNLGANSINQHAFGGRIEHYSPRGSGYIVTEHRNANDTIGVSSVVRAAHASTVRQLLDAYLAYWKLARELDLTRRENLRLRIQNKTQSEQMAVYVDELRRLKSQSPSGFRTVFSIVSAAKYACLSFDLFIAIIPGTSAVGPLAKLVHAVFSDLLKLAGSTDPHQLIQVGEFVMEVTSFCIEFREAHEGVTASSHIQHNLQALDVQAQQLQQHAAQCLASLGQISPAQYHVFLGAEGQQAIAELHQFFSAAESATPHNVMMLMQDGQMLVKNELRRNLNYIVLVAMALVVLTRMPRMAAVVCLLGGLAIYRWVAEKVAQPGQWPMADRLPSSRTLFRACLFTAVGAYMMSGSDGNEVVEQGMQNTR